MAKLTLLEQQRRVLRAMQRAQVVLADCTGSTYISSYCNDSRDYYSATFELATFEHTDEGVKIKERYIFEWTSSKWTSSRKIGFKKAWDEFMTDMMKKLWEGENNG